jgi:7,8-dihydropterin-6-yl-methyl-4-(beta-D-ribofuranosyl)aminobenzene 5'-phosphate synthase
MLSADAIRIDILFDNVPYDLALQNLWGFSALITLENRRILFDTGSNGRALLRNADALGISLKNIDTLFLSHQHWDHIGGLDTVLEENPDIELIIPASFSKRLINDLKGMIKNMQIITKETQQLYPDIRSTGLMGEVTKEHSLILKTDRGDIVITGCAHSGIVEIASLTCKDSNTPLLLLLGGFHLLDQTDEAIEETITALEKKPIRYYAPTHCSGTLAIEKFQQRFGSRCLQGGAGKSFILETLRNTF